MKKGYYEIFRVMLLVLIFSTVLHAFIQSALPKEASAAESDKVGEIIGEIIPPDTPPGEYIQKNIRKMAHFTEFMVLGLFSSLYSLFYMKKKNALSFTLPFGAAIALFDETIQIFSKRGPSVNDVWIDIFGYFSSFFAVFAVYFVIFFIRRRLSRQKDKG